jgi:hypothetical protein
MKTMHTGSSWVVVGGGKKTRKKLTATPRKHSILKGTFQELLILVRVYAVLSAKDTDSRGAPEQ